MPPSTPPILQIEKPDAVATLLFCDIAGYATMVSNMSAGHFLRKLNAHFEVVTTSLTEHRGTVAKFVGDALYAYWLAEEQPDHAQLACQFASTLRDRLAAASPDLETRIGIHTGNIALVRINHAAHHSLEPYGEPVNLTAQLEVFCAQEKAHAIASAQVIAHGGGGPAWIKLDSVVIKGQTSPVSLYRLG